MAMVEFQWNYIMNVMTEGVFKMNHTLDRIRVFLYLPMIVYLLFIIWINLEWDFKVGPQPYWGCFMCYWFGHPTQDIVNAIRKPFSVCSRCTHAIWIRPNKRKL